MSLPELEKTWEFDVNQPYNAGGTTLATHQTVLRGIKDSLVGVLAGRAAVQSPWTVKASSNGTSVNVPPDYDLWTADDKLVFGTAGHSWIVLEQQGISASFQICIDLSNSDSGLITVVWAPSGFTGGSPTARPTGSPEVVLLNNAAWLGGQDSIAFRIHAMQSVDGACTRVVGYHQNHPVLFWLFDKPNRTVSGWTVPAVALVSGTYDTLLDYAALHTVSSPNLKGYGTSAMSLWMSTESFGSSLGAVGAKLVSANSFDSHWPLTPIGLASLDAGQVGRHGELFDLWFGSTAANHGDTYPGDATRQFVQFGDLVFPWDGLPGDAGSTPETA